MLLLYLRGLLWVSSRLNKVSRRLLWASGTLQVYVGGQLDARERRRKK